MSENIFSALAKYNSACDENYLTEAFVFVLNHLLNEDREHGLGILSLLCINGEDFAFDRDEIISISTQEVTQYGTPDIKISSPNKLIYVEVKHDSGLERTQIDRYNKALELSNAEIKHVVLLTRFSVDFAEEAAKPYKHVRWYEIYNWLSTIKPSGRISAYLVQSLMSFLEDKQMSIQKVSWEYINGVRAFVNLINMIEVAIQAASLTIHQKSAAWDSKGFYIENNKFHCGIDYDEPLKVTFVILEKNLNKGLVTSDYVIEEDKDGIYFYLDLESIHFFSLSKDEQLEAITTFIEKCYADAQRMIQGK